MRSLINSIGDHRPPHAASGNETPPPPLLPPALVPKVAGNPRRIPVTFDEPTLTGLLGSTHGQECGMAILNHVSRDHPVVILMNDETVYALQDRKAAVKVLWERFRWMQNLGGRN